MSLRILGWEGYDDPSLIAPFNDRTGIAVELDAHISDFDAAERVLTGVGTWDLVNINSPFVRDVLLSAGHIEKLTSERLRAAAAAPMAPCVSKNSTGGGLHPMVLRSAFAKDLGRSTSSSTPMQFRWKWEKTRASRSPGSLALPGDTASWIMKTST